MKETCSGTQCNPPCRVCGDFLFGTSMLRCRLNWGCGPIKRPHSQCSRERASEMIATPTRHGVDPRELFAIWRYYKQPNLHSLTNRNLKRTKCADNWLPHLCWVPVLHIPACQIWLCSRFPGTTIMSPGQSCMKRVICCCAIPHKSGKVARIGCVVTRFGG